jgi:hypothetical protein
MTYFTSWDANVFLCLVTLGVPEDVVKRAVMVAKKTHEEFSLKEAMIYWTTNSPRLVRSASTRAWWVTQPLERSGVSLKFQINSMLECQYTRIHVFKRRLNLTKEFKQEWRLRSIEDRQKKVIEWCKFGSDDDQMRHQRRLSKFYGNRVAGESRFEWIEKSKELNKIREKYTNNLWQSWDAWSHCEHPPMIYHENTVRPQPQDRRNYISQWYEGIHTGRFFLFYKQNKIIEERNGGLPNGSREDGYVYPKTPIFDWGPYEQLIEDLRCIDGPGLGESGSKIEYIDDLFS